ncbi:hypothetical protein Leryth_014215 [Lithospermum erythrorhizon]|uniref:Ligand-gated ion channel n=1 Tax=Lithospermum erythrorhizon TaxID=34254 RepID=A0AAV3QY86_LITER|nr:hypothetical protein Leryth_014215 [Lithospermum erythrorhizon]
MFKTQYIGGKKEKFVRLNDLDSNLSFKSDMAGRRVGFSLEGKADPVRSTNRQTKSFRFGVMRGSEGLKTIGRSLKSGVTRVMFPEDLKVSDHKIFDPQDKHLLFWNKLLVLSCIVAVSVDPLFLYLPIFKTKDMCLHIDENLAYTTTTLRSLIDAFYLIRMVFQFRTAYIAPSSRVFGRGELVIDPRQIASRYIHRYFFVDLLSVLPLPQIVIWRFLNSSTGSDVLGTKNSLLVIVILQYIPRFGRIIPLNSELRKTSGAFAESAWAGAVYYLVWFVLASHIAGAFWYLIAIDRRDKCWETACLESSACNTKFLYCTRENINMTNWKIIGKEVLDFKCSVGGQQKIEFQYGIYSEALTSKVIESDKKFIDKFFYCLWWGLKNLSTLGQGLETSTYTLEVIFSITISIVGLLLFALLIGNMQTYLQSLTVRLEEMRIKRRDSEQWMHHRVLPQELRQKVRRYDQYKWVETRGVDEESLVQNLPKDLRRDIKRHLCLSLVRRVPLFGNMDERLLDAICERLKPSLYTENTYIIREGDPVEEMIFIIRGRLESVTTDGGRSGFFNRGFLTEGDFCGEELLTWVLDPKSGTNLPPSTRTVKALTEVEAFALPSEELKYITTQFRRIHSRQIQQTFRFYSQQWRTWGASFIQAAWRRYVRRRQLEELLRNEMEDSDTDSETDGLIGNPKSRFRSTMLASRFAANAMRGVHRLRSSRKFVPIPAKPSEPDFEND